MTNKIILAIIFITLAFGQNVDSLKIKTPKKAALWSILPGGGQIYNGKYIKAGIIIALESLAVQQSIKNGDLYKSKGDDKYLSQRNENAWWALFIHVYGTLDAVVDSHLKPFKEIMSEEPLEGDSDIKEGNDNGE